MNRFPCVAAIVGLVSVCSLALGGELTLTASNAEIVVAPGALRATQFAAKELKGFLDRALAADVPIVAAPTAGRASVVLGTNAWSAAAGIDVAAKPRDTFVIRAAGGRLYIAGLDSDADVGSLVKLGRPTDLRSLARTARATVFGVYEFLERFAGCRFYFPGEMGEIVPRRDRIVVPEGTYVVRSPRFTQRSVSLNGGASGPDQALNWVRLRLETDHIQCGHGLNSFDYARRFADTHPEYFCLKADGTRATLKEDPNPRSQSHPVGQLCHTSKVWDEIAEDVLSYFRGESAERRTGRPHWQKNCRGDHVDIMPQDGMWKCRCDTCRAAYDTNLGANYANTLIWRHTAEVARKVQDAGLKGRVAQMAYSPYSAVPDFDLPPNLDVMVATMGPWSLKDESLFARTSQNVKDWSKKLGHTVWLWTYPGKVNAMNLPAAPQVAPKVWGKYYKRMAPYVFGAFNESESDSFYFNYLNFYVFSRVAWNPSVDVDAIVAEHHRLMYGKGAPAMAKFFDRLEDIWLNELTREDNRTSTGGEPSYSPPGPYKLLTQVYSKKTLQELRTWLKEAAAAVEPGGADACRIRFAAEKIFQPIWKRAREYQRGLDPECEEERRARAVSVQTVPATAQWWCKDAERTVEGDKTIFTVRPGGKGMLGLKAAGVTLKPNTRYRASCYLTTHLNDLPFKEIKKGHGFLFELSEERSRKRLHRVTGLFGERPRESHGFDFETGDEVGEGGSFAVYMYGVTGTVEMDGLAVMELGPALKTKDAH